MLRFRDLKHQCNYCGVDLTFIIAWRFLLGIIAFSPLFFAKTIATYLVNSLDITFDLQGETYDVMSVDVIEDESYIQEVYDFMLNTDNTYFKTVSPGRV